MYFVVVGKNEEFSLKEIELLNPKNVKKIYYKTFSLETDFPEFFSKLGGIVKRGKIIDFDYIQEMSTQKLFGDKKILGTNSKDIGVSMKKMFDIKRFKEVLLEKTDIEVKEKGVEILDFGGGSFGIVQGYQNIELYEEIDYNKPVRSMNIGMMPSKLTHIMLNIGISEYLKKNSFDITNLNFPTIYDPFVGLGTTGFVSNYFGYHFIGSDINASPSKQNLKWWQNSDFIQDKKITLFKHDITEKFTKNFLKNVGLIITEGWLGPIVKNNTSDDDKKQNQEEILSLYKSFIKNVYDFWEDIILVFTIPIYTEGKDKVFETIKNYSLDMGFDFNYLDETYFRKKQNIGRKIIILKK